MTTNTYSIGTLVQLQGTFTDINGALIDPTTVVCTVETPSLNVVTVATTKASTGVYTANYTPQVAGTHSYKFQGSGSCTVSSFGTFTAKGSY